MGYRGVLLTRWSRRDWLAILVIAVTVAFLTGTTFLLVAAGDQTAQVASNRGSPGSATYYDDPGAARTAAGSDQVVLPVAEVTNGSTHTLLVGVPEGLDTDSEDISSRLRRASGNTTTLGTIATSRVEQLEGPSGAVSVRVQPRGPRTSLLDRSWYVTNEQTVEQVGVSGAFVIQSEADTSTTGGAESVPLRSALQFFLSGMGSVLRTFTAIASGAALLVGVTVYSISRISVRDRLSTIKIIRATGGRPRTVLGLFTLRASLLTVVGVGLGYAFGVILTNGTVNLAVTLGLPTSFSLQADARVIRVLVSLYVAVIGVGGIAGAVAAWSAANRPPGELDAEEVPRRRFDSLPDLLSPSLLHWRTLVPTTATLTTFVAFIILLSAIAGVVGPISGGGGATITQSGSIHPIASIVPEAYAEALRSQGINASAEILLFEMVDGEPVLARGAKYEAFERVTDAELVRGRTSKQPSEALVGADLAQSHGIEIGDTITLGGSTEVSLTRVEIVGVFAAPGPFDDQLLLPLPTARHLAGRAPGEVHLIRADRLPAGTDDGPPSRSTTGVGVVNLSVGERVSPNASFVAAVTLRNEGLERTRTSVPVTFGDQRQNVTVELRANQQRTVRVEFTTATPGAYTLEAGNATTAVRVVDPEAIVLTGVPDQAPPGSHPLVTVTKATGTPISGANVTVANWTGTTDERGRIRLPLRTAGRTEVTVQHGSASATGVVQVTREATRALSMTLQVRPTNPSLTTRPEARIVLANPWAEPVNATVRVDGPGVSRAQPVTVQPGERAVVTTRLAQQPPGAYLVHASIDDREAEEVEYRVTGDQRIVSALATSGRGRSTGLSQGIDVLFGNFQIFLGGLLGLAALMTVGGTTATFAQAVYARRRTIGIHRATGAPPRRVLRLVLADAARIGLVASIASFLIALLALQILGAAGYLTVFGVSLQPIPSLLVTISILLGALCVTLLGATLTTLALLRRSPASLLAQQEGATPARGQHGGDR